MLRMFLHSGVGRSTRNERWVLPQPFDAPAGMPQLRLRPMQIEDWDEYCEVTERNAQWLEPWRSSNPVLTPSLRVSEWVIAQHTEIREGRGAQLLMEHGGHIVGQISLGAVVYGSVRSGIVGYWVDQAWAGHRFAPLAVAMLTQWALCDANGPQLHRIEIAILPENTRSHAVVRKLGFHFEGTMRRYMYVNNAWRDHDIFTCLAEDIAQHIGESNSLIDKLR